MCFSCLPCTALTTSLSASTLTWGCTERCQLSILLSWVSSFKTDQTASPQRPLPKLIVYNFSHSFHFQQLLMCILTQSCPWKKIPLYWWLSGFLCSSSSSSHMLWLENFSVFKNSRNLKKKKKKIYIYICVCVRIYIYKISDTSYPGLPKKTKRLCFSTKNNSWKEVIFFSFAL